MTSLPREIYSYRLKNNTVIKFTLIYSNPYVIIVLQYRSICLSIRDSKMEGVSIKILGRATLKRFGCVKPRANGGNIVGQQLPTLLDATCCVRLYTLLLVVGCYCAKFETGQTFSYVQTDATTPNNVGSCLPAVLHPFAHGFTAKS